MEIQDQYESPYITRLRSIRNCVNFARLTIATFFLLAFKLLFLSPFKDEVGERWSMKRIYNKSHRHLR